MSIEWYASCSDSKQSALPNVEPHKSIMTGLVWGTGNIFTEIGRCYAASVLMVQALLVVFMHARIATQQALPGLMG